MNIGNLIGRRTHAYKVTFPENSRDAEIVLADLKKHCAWDHPARVHEGKIDPILLALMQGRREMFIRIMDHLHYDENQLRRLQEATATEY